MRVLALDIGGTWLRADVDGRTLQARTPGTGREALAATLELAGDAAVDAVGVSFGGRVHGEDVVSLHVPGWEDTGLADALRERYGAPVTIANDANAGALAEWDAAGRPEEPVAYVTVSTGVGAGIVAGGRILEGANGLAGEIGHLVVDPDGEPCACGKRGCVETLASGPALARHGDYAAAAHALGIAVDALRAVVDPAFVAIGGGVAAAPQLWEALGVGARRAKSTPLHGARVLVLLAVALLLSACGGGKASFTNPVYDRDFPDPFVLKVGGTYYAYATNGNGSNVQTATSKDLVHWTPGSDALPKLGTASSGTQCIGRAIATAPQGPFVDSFAGALVCQKSDGGSIDPDAYGGYLYWKNDGNSIGRPTQIRDLFYSGGSFNDDSYAVGYATCRGPLGPSADAPENPILETGCRAHGPGHNTFAGPYIAYHAWNAAHTRRQLWLSRLDWQDGKPVVHGPC